MDFICGRSTDSRKLQTVGADMEQGRGNAVFSLSCAFKNTIKRRRRFQSDKSVCKQQAAGSFVAGRKTTELFFEEEGFYEVEIRHKDGEYYHRRIYVELSDPSAPKISTGGYKEGIWTKEDVALKLLGAKSLTGIDHYEYRREGGEWKEVLDEKIFLDETMDERVQARAVSKAGRQGEISEIRIKIWKIRPNKVKLYCKEKVQMDGFAKSQSSIGSISCWKADRKPNFILS